MTEIGVTMRERMVPMVMKGKVSNDSVMATDFTDYLVSMESPIPAHDELDTAE